MKPSFRRAGALSAAVFAVAALALAVPGAALASAAPPYEPDTVNQLGTLAFYDAAGSQISSGSTTADPFYTYAVASSDDPIAANTKATLYGCLPKNGVAPGGWTCEQLSGSTTFPVTGAGVPAGISGLGTHRPVNTGAAGDTTLNQLAQDLPNTATDAYQGLYQLRLKTPGNSQFWAADVQLTGSTWSQVYPTVTAPASTSTSLAASPSGSASSGQNVTLTATVSPAAAGTVQFKDGGTALGSPVAVSSGTASFSTTSLAQGSHSFTAEFTPTDSTAYSSSASTAVGYSVTAPATTTSLAVSPATQQYQGSNVTLTATLSPSAAAGTVQFKDGGTDVGAPVAVSSGTASYSSTGFTVGSHSFTAEFTPTDATSYAGSSSAPVSYSVVGAPSWKPTLYGPHRVAYVDSCIASFDNATSVSYAWLNNGVPISGATASTYKVPEGMFHRTLSCRVTATNPAGTSTGTSSGATVGVGPALVPTARPYLYGNHVHGQYEYVNHGTWSPAATAYTYQWYVDGSAISGARYSRFLVPASYRGHTLTCVVRATRGAAWTPGAYRTAGVRITA